MRCANADCVAPIRWQQFVHWCIRHNVCICEDCHRDRIPSKHLDCDTRALKLVESRPKVSTTKCSGHLYLMGNIPYFQGVTCGHCFQYNICELCIRHSDSRTLLVVKHICKQMRHSSDLWHWKGNETGVARLWGRPI